MKLKQYRKDKKITLANFATQSGVSAAHICMIESGKRKPSIELLKKIIELTKNKVNLKDFK